MHADIALRMMGEMFWTAFIVSAPILLITLLVGSLISIVQVVTQVQDPSISFVPKLAAFIVALLLLAPWMLGKLTGYGSALFERLVHVT